MVLEISRNKLFLGDFFGSFTSSLAHMDWIRHMDRFTGTVHASSTLLVVFCDFFYEAMAQKL